MSVYYLLWVGLLGGIVLSLGSVSWVGVWVGLEINLASFVTLSCYGFNSNTIEGVMKYFLVQVISSQVLLLGGGVCLTNSLIYDEEVMVMVLLLKGGLAPFHFWFPSVSSILSWGVNFILGVVQKIVPVFLILFIDSWLFVIVAIVGGSVFGCVGSVGQTHLRKFMAYSAIFNGGWFFGGGAASMVATVKYYLLYSFMVWLIMKYMSKFCVYKLGDLLNDGAMVFGLGILSYGGFPPFVGFFLKMDVLYMCVSGGGYLEGVVLMFGSLVMGYVYVRVMLMLFMGGGEKESMGMFMLMFGVYHLLFMLYKYYSFNYNRVFD